ncbi:hypothetical protein DQ353_03445 [Arthrobacter sp. AQ5-05]|uniref:FAD/NAD(P)-binding protein n=1 Tax=Arthrobacter sp. AQ5-05 TaxID=2184581 RepID=UPI000DCC751E|nr:FAD/NAD(P)-binding protein [Arthrobacter sp. AQ5-05]RAX50612.1 hypothetical protein DQ353_03445 [Arthrobacter sp. AQ5-05]
MTRIAFVGGGPKALFALLELNDQCSPVGAEDLSVDVFDPYPPGAGRVWQAGQPRHVRLNVAAGIVDATSAEGAGSFASWVARVEPRYVTERYPPRAVVGSYLRERFRTLAETASFQLAHVPARVTGVARAGELWEVAGDAGTGFYDEVVLATGHGLPGEAPGPRFAGARNQDALIGDYGALGEASIPAGSRVLIRGAALTAYDAVLLLTEGRGGRWIPAEGAGGPSLGYVPTGREPAKIAMGSLSNLPTDPKPVRVPESINRCLDAYRDQVLAWGAGPEARPGGPGARCTGLFGILLACAMECAQLSGAPATPLALWRTALTGRGEPGPGTETAAEHLRRSIAVNRGHTPPGTAWVWGRVWSGLYPQLVLAVSRVRWDPAQARIFRRVARSLERMAFGPPENTALKLLALFDSGLLDQGAFPQHAPADTLVIDAVTPPPGILAAPAPGGAAFSPVMAGLLAAGELMVREGETGMLTDTDGTCLDASGNRNESLAALGRPTEGPTLGHDTLNRSLHDEHVRWARRIARQRMPQDLGERT